MPWTIYRYILWDLVKLLVISAAVLVMVVSFAAAIKPLSDGLLTAGSLLKFVGYTSPTMLAFVLPFAGAFASTIVFLRLSSDNEVTAMSASGLSYASILTPVFVLGLALTLGLFYLSNFVIPGFYRAAAQTLEDDLMSVLVSNLNQDRPFDMDDYVLHADTATRRPLSPREIASYDTPVPPSQLIELTGVAVGQLDAAGRIHGDATARRANVVVFRGDRQSWINILLLDVMQYDAVRGQLFSSPRVSLGPIELPSPLRDQPEFLSWERLRELPEAPERYGDIRELKRALADEVAAEQLRLLVAAVLRRPGEAGGVVLLGQRDAERYILSAPIVEREGGELRLSAGEGRPVVVKALLSGRVSRRFEAAGAALRVERSRGAAEPSILIELHETRVYHAGAEQPSTEQEVLPMPRMRWPEPVLSIDVDDFNAFELYRFSQEPPYGESRAVSSAANRLWEQIIKLGHKVKGHLHQRAASAVACLLVLMLGAVLSMKLKGQMPLVVYFWSFALAIITVIIIYTGTNLAGNSDFPLAMGLAILWSGNVALAIVIGVTYCRLARN